jgi:hypothetical protein
MNRPRCADDFPTIRARMQELRREREATQAPPSDLPQDPPMRPAKYGYGSQPQRDISAAPTASPTISRDTRLGRDGHC